MTKKTWSLLLAIALVAATMFAAVAEEHPVGGQLIYASSTEISGDWAPSSYWTNNASDAMIRRLIYDCNPVANDKDGGLLVNNYVAESLEGVVNEDGTKTFTIKIKDGLKFSDGQPVTARDFIVSPLLFSHPTLLAKGSKAISHLNIVGGKEYKDGSADGTPVPFAGLRLIDDHTYSITIVKEKIPYFYDLNYCYINAIPTHVWLGEGYEVKDDGQGAYIVGDMSAETIMPHIEAIRFKNEGYVSCGPYNLVNYDKGAKQAVLEINPYYQGNFEGQKPSVQKLLIVKAETATQFDALKTGDIEMISGLNGGDEINTALDMVKAGGFNTVTWERAGYGKLMFQCDFGPTQFKAVRHAIAYLLNRPEFANTFTGGYGGLVHGPYGVGLWQYKATEEELDERLKTYAYSYDDAVKALEEDGWVLNEKGEPWTEGIRYKEVSAEEAGEYVHNITVGGKTLMPLIIEWSSSENNPVSELLVTMLAENPDVAKAGMQIKQNVMTFSELLNWMYRDSSQGAQYAVPTYGMYNLASNFNPEYDYSYEWSLDPELVVQGYNTNRLFIEELDKLSMDMVYGVESTDKETYLKYWVDFVAMFNEELPDIPLYSNQYYTIFADKLQGFEQGPFWNFERAILYSWVK